jgi:two-component sensor histidine kinase
MHHWESADLRELLSGSLAPYAGTTSDRVVLRGEDVVLRPRAVLTLAMAVHELTTNAAKYGALSVPGGRVEVQWRPATGKNDQAQLYIEWAEHGGPPVVEPEQHGFGSKLIEGSIAELGGEARLVFQPGGLRCEIAIPVKTAAVDVRTDAAPESSTSM